jgi:hypothetical protein
VGRGRWPAPRRVQRRQEDVGDVREYCWRVRRRTPDEAGELRRLADIGHEIQEDLAYHQLWTRAENAFVGRVFREVRADLADQLGPVRNAAWAEPPIIEAQGMILGDWGPDDLDAHLERFESAVAFRFGWHRVLGAVHLHLGVTPRPAQAETVEGPAQVQPAGRKGTVAEIEPAEHGKPVRVGRHRT